MKFIKAKTAREITDEYNKGALKRFIDQLNERIETAAHTGENYVWMDIGGFSLEEQAFIRAFLEEHGFKIGANRPGHSINRYSVSW